MGRANSPLRDRMIFNVGAQRSGTFWLQRIVTAHPAVSAVPSETALFSHGVAPLAERFQHGARGSPRVGTIHLERDRLLDALRDFCDVALAPHLETGAAYLAERTPVHVRHVELIADVYPDARVIHIIRDGRDVARSVLSRPWGSATIEDAAEEWRAAILAARAADLPPERYREVRYEDLLQDPRREIEPLLDWLGLPTDDRVWEQVLLEAGRSASVGKGEQVAVGKWREGMTAREQVRFERVAGDLLDELGYASGRARPHSTEMRLYLARLRDWTRRRAGSLPTLSARSREGGRSAHGRHLSLVEAAVDALMNGDIIALRRIAVPDLVVRVVTDAGADESRGAAGLNLITRLLREGWFQGRQILGDPHPGMPTTGYVLSFERGGDERDHALFVTVEDERVTALALYRFPLAS